MSEPTEPVEDPKTPAPKKKLGLRPKTRDALLEVIERKRQRLAPNYKSVALRHGISFRSLKTIVAKFNAGEVELGVPQTIEELQIDKGVEMKRSLAIFDRLESLLNDSLEGLLARVEKFHGAGKLLAYRDLGIPLVLSDKKSLQTLRNLTERGFMDILKEAMRERELKSAIPVECTAIISAATLATDEQRAIEALRNARSSVVLEMEEA